MDELERLKAELTKSSFVCRMREPFTEFIAAIYLDDLSGLDPGVCADAVGELRKADPFFPTVAAIRNLAGEFAQAERREEIRLAGQMRLAERRVWEDRRIADLELRLADGRPSEGAEWELFRADNAADNAAAGLAKPVKRETQSPREFIERRRVALEYLREERENEA